MADKINLSFKETETEQELYNWILEKAKIIGRSNYIKQILYESMLKDKETTK